MRINTQRPSATMRMPVVHRRLVATVLVRGHGRIDTGILRHKPCARCQITYYCSKDCQKRHWKEGHKQNCVAPADRKASVALGVAQAAEKAKGIAGGIHQSAAAGESGPKDASHRNNRNNYDGSKKAQRAKKKGAAVEKEEYEYDENDECAMCLESLKSAKVLTLPCSHTYHAACVGKLREFGITQVCPLCRADLPPGPEQVFDDECIVIRYCIAATIKALMTNHSARKG